MYKIKHNKHHGLNFRFRH